MDVCVRERERECRGEGEGERLGEEETIGKKEGERRELLS